ncbi:MAG: coenzyme F420-0:L-glutamate ligase [Myxococcota bacterium]|nr:coenzyme F420-0:L-glutamate ligase [Myxococcota bacterium]
MIACAARLEVFAVPDVPLVGPGADMPAVVSHALVAAGIALADGDVLVVTSKVLSRAEGRFVDLARVRPSDRAIELAKAVGKDARVVELILCESIAVSRTAPGVLVVRHRLGFVVANAGIDASNAVPPGAEVGSGPWALLLPQAPDASAAAIRGRLELESGARIGVVVSDSFGRPFRLGTVGTAIGVSGMPPLWDRRGEPDLFGRALEQTVTALGDQVAAAADLVAGQAAEGRPLVVVRGLSFGPCEQGARTLTRTPEEDLYA